MTDKYLHLPPDGKRLIYDLTPFGLPEVPYLAAQNLPTTTPALPTHIHKGRMEINHFLKGERVYRVGGRDYHLRGNEIFLTWPDEVHGCGLHLHGRGLHFWTQIALPRPGEPFLGFNAETAAPLLDALWNLPKRQFHADPAMRGLYSRILMLSRKGPSPLATVEISALFAEWLLLVVDCASRDDSESVTPDIARALDLANRNAGRHVSVGELADAACLSESHFKLKFKQQLGMPPGEFLLRKRLEAAAELLHGGGKNITDIAFRLGFSSSQHFSNTFRKFFGKSPVAWTAEQGKAGADAPEAAERAGADGLRPWVEEGVFHGYICD